MAKDWYEKYAAERQTESLADAVRQAERAKEMAMMRGETPKKPPAVSPATLPVAIVAIIAVIVSGVYIIKTITKPTKWPTYQSMRDATPDPESGPRPRMNETPISVSAYELGRAYQENEIAADQQYKGRMLSVHGDVRSIGKGAFGGLYVTIDSGSGARDIMCRFGKGGESKLATLRRGDTITVVGRCEGESMLSVVIYGGGD
jgi:hypothetical protein